jgi:hypothetical protein
MPSFARFIYLFYLFLVVGLFVGLRHNIWRKQLCGKHVANHTLRKRISEQTYCEQKSAKTHLRTTLCENNFANNTSRNKACERKLAEVRKTKCGENASYPPGGGGGPNPSATHRTHCRNGLGGCRWQFVEANTPHTSLGGLTYSRSTAMIFRRKTSGTLPTRWVGLQSMLITSLRLSSRRRRFHRARCRRRAGTPASWPSPTFGDMQQGCSQTAKNRNLATVPCASFLLMQSALYPLLQPRGPAHALQD